MRLPPLLPLTGLLLLVSMTARAAPTDLGGGFLDYGVAAPVAGPRGIVATTAGAGAPVVLVWLYDYRGSYALLMVDAATGHTDQFPTPFDQQGDAPYASLLSSRNRYYTAFGSHFAEFDPAQRKFTYVQALPPQMAMSMTEDDRGLIWLATYPNCDLLSFDPAGPRLTDYGPVHHELWPQYPRTLAVDDAGWVYLGLGYGASGIFAFDPQTRAVRSLLPPSERQQGKMAYVFRATDGKVYEPEPGMKQASYQFYRGEATRPAATAALPPVKPLIAGYQWLVWRRFPDGKQLQTLDLDTRLLTVEDPQTQQVTRVPFDYASEGPSLMGVAVLPGGVAGGGTFLPCHAFQYDLRADAWTRSDSAYQWNALAPQSGHLFVGAYNGGYLLDGDPRLPWSPSPPADPPANPAILTHCEPTINRPSRVLAYPDGKTVIMAGTPAYGYTGGGLLFWNRETGASVLLRDDQVVPDQSTESLLALPAGRLLGGTTVTPGTGGVRKAPQAVLYLMDVASKTVEWQAAVLRGATEYTDLALGRDGLVYGVANLKLFFVFDPTTRRLLYQEDLTRTFGPAPSQQGPRVFVPGEGGRLFALFGKSLAEVNQTTQRLILLAHPPVPVTAGGDFYQGRLFFASNSHLCSYAVPAERP